MRNDIYGLAAMSLCSLGTSAVEVRQCCENMELDDKDRSGLLAAVTALHQEYRDQLGQIARDEMGRPLSKADFASLFFKVNCLASAKGALSVGH